MQFCSFHLIDQVRDHQKDSNDEATTNLLKIIHEDSEEPVEIPEKHELFGHVALSLLEKGKGAVTCKACTRIYEANQLKSVVLGAGKSPLHVKAFEQVDKTDLITEAEKRDLVLVVTDDGVKNVLGGAGDR